jgi:hypothetical protein
METVQSFLNISEVAHGFEIILLKRWPCKSIANRHFIVVKRGKRFIGQVLELMAGDKQGK